MKKVKNIREYYIYGLVDPNNGMVRYIGASKMPYQRLLGHCCLGLDDWQRDTLKGEWIYELKIKGQRPFICLLDLCSIDMVDELESKYYDIYNIGENLLNTHHPSKQLYTKATNHYRKLALS